MLAEQDSQAAAAIHPNNRKKVIRALERLREGEGRVRPFSGMKNETKDYDVLLIGLTRERAELYDRINRRVDILVEQGLFDEVEKLRDMGLTAENISMKGIGYKEISTDFQGNIRVTKRSIRSKKHSTLR
ncbi:MAG: tRNA dimethylallyltransferase [Clostridia bacterium]